MLILLQQLTQDIYKIGTKQKITSKKVQKIQEKNNKIQKKNAELKKEVKLINNKLHTQMHSNKKKKQQNNIVIHVLKLNTTNRSIVKHKIEKI